jgi:hypothetical protein
MVTEIRVASYNNGLSMDKMDYDSRSNKKYDECYNTPPK